ncbi:hypothetical protein NUW58_g10523 [Xylaria curta]|uniref:Uncharacterized protein n=1 Tax=Xylaria curta TaxID=42375 RepID=A0ACC1MJ94_9PEZI|nr:hypothetical protein NUW58_g10523 [Xylaria curta]
MSLILNAPAQKQRLDSTFGDKIEPLGFDRFKTCELMAELLHCSNMALLNEFGSEQVIARRDEERRRLRLDGRLTTARGEESHSSEDLTMRTRHSSSPDDSRRLGVTNASDDDGFEEVTPSGEMTEDTSHEFVKAEDEIPVATSTSFLDKDDDDEFVDEPLSSPRLNVQNGNMDEHHFEIPELVVAPLSPKKLARTESEPSLAQANPTTTPGNSALIETTNQPSASNEASHANEEGSPISTGGLEISVTEVAPEDPVISKADPTEDTAATTAAAVAAAAETTNAGPVPVAENSGFELSATAQPPLIPDTEPQTLAHDDQPLVAKQAAESTPQATASEQPEPVVGDFLKMQFVGNNVVPTILSFFFRYPWNNFLHNVVYDIVQQVFNGPMDRGFNPTLAISLFEAADITNAIINGQISSENSQAHSKTRMGFMGHLTLIAEEVVKFTERNPPELLSDLRRRERGITLFSAA